MGREILMNNDGDLVSGHDKDIVSLEQDSNKDIALNIMRAIQGDDAYTGIKLSAAANLSDFRGKPLTDELLSDIKERITDVLNALYPIKEIVFEKSLYARDTLVMPLTVYMPNGIMLQFTLGISEQKLFMTYAN